MKCELKNYTVTYPARSQPLLSNFSFICPTAGLYFIQGANGAGKSTLFNSLKGYSTNARVQGTISFDAITYDISSDDYKQYACNAIALVPQNYDELLVPHYTVKENLSCASGIKVFPSFIHSTNAFYKDSTLQSIDISYNVAVENLSGGQRQIVSIMMALQKPRKVLLLDEPTATLDPANTELVMEFIIQIIKERNLIVLMICHDQELVNLYKNKSEVMGAVIKL